MKKLKMLVDPQGVDKGAWKKAFDLAMKLSEHGNLGWCSEDGEMRSVPIEDRPYDEKTDSMRRVWRANYDLANHTGWDDFLLPETFPDFDEVFFPSTGDLVGVLVNRAKGEPYQLCKPYVLWDGVVCGESAFLHMLSIAMVFEHFCPKAVLVDGNLDTEVCGQARQMIQDVTGAKISLPVQFDLEELYARMMAFELEEPADEISMLLTLYCGELNEKTGAFLSRLYEEHERMAGCMMLEGPSITAETWVLLGYDTEALSYMLELSEPEILDLLLEAQHLQEDERDYWSEQFQRLAARAGKTVLEMYQILANNDGLRLLHQSYEILCSVKTVFQVETLWAAIHERGWI